MSNKLTLITPPDIFENENYSILFMGLSEDQQDAASVWLKNNTEYPECNLYYFQGENNPTWLLYAANRADKIFLNFDTDYAIINLLGSYFLGRPKVYYTTKDENLKALMSHINNRFVPNVESFLEKAFND